MSDYRQPWRKIDLQWLRVRLQILDPETAFEFEPKLVRILGDAVSFAVAAPSELLGTVSRHALPGASGMPEIHDLARDPVRGPEIASHMITLLGNLLAECVSDLSIDPQWAAAAFRRMILGRLEIDGVPIDNVEVWRSLGCGWMLKWKLLGAQIQQSFGPLWTRSPYNLRSTAKDYGVTAPRSVSVAKRWANSLAVRGSAASAREILREWTPVEMIEIVETAAYEAEIERRAQTPERTRQR